VDDDNVGRLPDYLTPRPLEEHALVICTSDQGFFLGDHGWYDKRLMYEESLRMPFLVRYPAAIRPRSVNDDIVRNVDFAPMFLDYAGAKAPAEMQGRSFRANLEGRTPANWRQAMYYRYWMHLPTNVAAHYGIRTERWKPIYYYGKALDRAKPSIATRPSGALFDLKRDPREMKNLYGDPASAPVVKQLKAELARLRKQYKDEDGV
jgi:arylsulfatase A-like enzyme